MLNSRELKGHARQVLRRRLMPLLLTAAAFLVVDYLINYLANELSGLNAWSRELIRHMDAYIQQIGEAPSAEELEEIYTNLIPSMPEVGSFARGAFAVALSWLINLMSVPLTAGYCWHMIQESRGVATHVGSLLHGFQVTLKTLAVTLLTSLLVALGGLLYVIPGIILAYRYALAIYILMDDPSKGVIQCMEESGALMRGNKWRLFKLELSFIGWNILESLITTIVGLPIFKLWLTPYSTLAHTAFYNEVLGLPPTTETQPEM